MSRRRRSSSTIAVRTDAELRWAMSQVQYGWNRMVLLCMIYSRHVEIRLGPGTNPESAPLTDDRGEAYFGALFDGVLEAFLLHARTLIDFFLKPTNRSPDDIVASDFFADPDVLWRGLQRADLDRDRGRMGRKLAHLSYARMRDPDGWNPRALIDRLAVLRDRFNGLGPAYPLELEIGDPIDPRRSVSGASD